jgi:hypothetical protein
MYDSKAMHTYQQHSNLQFRSGVLSYLNYPFSQVYFTLLLVPNPPKENASSESKTQNVHIRRH